MRKTLYALLLLGTGCGASLAEVKTHPADYKMPAPESIDSEAERSKLRDAMQHARLGDAARDSGNTDQARAEWKATGALFQNIAERHASSEYRLVYRQTAARYLLQAQDWEGAAAAAEGLRADKATDPASRATAAGLRAAALQNLAFAEVKAGRAEPIRLLTADKRRGQEPKPRPLSPAWQRFVAASDDYLAQLKDDRSQGAEANAAGFATLAAQVEFSFDNLEDAGRRFGEVIEKIPSSSHLADSIQLHLQTYAIRKDEVGYAAALERNRAVLAAEVKKAAGRTDAEGKVRAEALAKLGEELERATVGTTFRTAGILLAESQKVEGEAARAKAAEAAAAYEKFAAADPTSSDAPNALYNGAIAWTRAKEPKKAVAARERLLAQYPDSKIAPKALLAVASDLSSAGDHVGSAQRYARYLEKYPDGEERCLALGNHAVELDTAGRPLEALRAYLAFGAEARCLKEDPNNSVKSLYRAASVATNAKRKADATALFRAIAGIQGVTDTVARSQVEDAKKRLK